MNHACMQHLKCVASWVFRTGSMSTSFTTTLTSLPLKPSVRAPSASKSACRCRGANPRALTVHALARHHVRHEQWLCREG